MSVKISIICPIYNGEKYIKNLNMSLLEQKIDNAEVDIKYLLTESNDNSEKILKEIMPENYPNLLMKINHQLQETQ